MRTAANLHRLSACRLVPLAAALVVAAVQPAIAQDFTRITGFTRPGNPSDRRDKGAIIGALNDEGLRKSGFGGTIYFTVLPLKGGIVDTWDSGLKDFNVRFRPGIDFNGTASPALDTTAKYLYLFQAVNHRRTLGRIVSASVKLLGEMKELTSWGYFHGVGFAVPAPPGGARTGIQPVSFTHSVSGAAEQMYLEQAPEVPVAQPYSLVRVPTLRGEKAPKVKGEKPAIAVRWDALDPARNPDHVMVLSSSETDKKPSFRAIWSADNVLDKDARSTVFGFTSNQPPTMDTVQLRSPGKPGIRGAMPGDGAKLGAPGEEFEIAFPPAARLQGKEEKPKPKPDNLVAEGRGPTPQPSSPLAAVTPKVPDETAPSAPAAAAAAAGPTGGAGDGLGRGARFGGGSPGTPTGLGTGARPSIGGGGGGGSSSGSGQNNATRTATNSGSASATVQNQNMFFNPTLTNQQQQQQRQQQQQQQQQDQSSSCCTPTDPNGPPGEVIPEPAAFLLAALGLPFLLLLRRRQKPA